MSAPESNPQGVQHPASISCEVQSVFNGRTGFSWTTENHHQRKPVCCGTHRLLQQEARSQGIADQSASEVTAFIMEVICKHGAPEQY